MAGLISGVAAELRWGYHVAGVVRDWTVTQTDGARHLTATVVQTDAFRVDQRPLVFVVTHQKGVWRWPIESLDVGPNQLRATLGAPEP